MIPETEQLYQFGPKTENGTETKRKEDKREKDEEKRRETKKEINEESKREEKRSGE